MARRKVFKDENLKVYTINMARRHVHHGKISDFPNMIAITKEDSNDLEFGISNYRLAELINDDAYSYEIFSIMKIGLANLKSITVKAEIEPTNKVKFISEIIDHEQYYS